MRLAVCSVIVGWLFLGVCCAQARGDGGTIRMSGKKGDLLVTVFTAPTPLRAGPADISVLVQDASTGQPLSQARVIVRMAKNDESEQEYPATPEAATNKLLHAAQIELPGPGRWKIEVQVESSQGSAVIGGEVEAAERLPRWRDMWPWLAWPGLVVALFAIHQVLARRRSAKRSAPISHRPD
jgi:hypothetical protein